MLDVAYHINKQLSSSMVQNQ
eukprot:SAG31_NODE_44187_length_263_cov_23.067073_1_plen_20_part_01